MPTSGGGGALGPAPHPGNGRWAVVLEDSLTVSSKLSKYPRTRQHRNLPRGRGNADPREDLHRNVHNGFIIAVPPGIHPNVPAGEQAGASQQAGHLAPRPLPSLSDYPSTHLDGPQNNDAAEKKPDRGTGCEPISMKL